MKYVRQRLIQLVIVVFAVTHPDLHPPAPAPRRPGDQHRRHRGHASSSWPRSATSGASTSRSPSQYVKWLRKVVTGDLGISSAFNVQGHDLDQRAPAGLAVPDVLRDAPLAGHRHPARDLDRLPGQPPDRPNRQHASRSGCCRCRRTSSACCSSSSSRCKLGWLPALSKYDSPFDDPVEHFQRHGPAGDHARPRPDRHLPAPAAGRHGRHAAERLHHAGPGQGHVDAAHPVPPRPATIDVLAHHRRRRERRRAHRRRRHRRDDLRPARHGRAHRPGHLPARLPRGAVLRRDLRRRLRARELLVDLLYNVLDPRIRHARALA